MAEHDSKQPPERVQNLIGNTYGRWTVVSYSHREKRPRQGFRYYWLCECNCGTRKQVRSDHLKSGASSSCGCYVQELNTIHGHTAGGEYTKVYKAWTHMKDRCHNENHPDYNNYGGRGITVCEEWRDSFESFLEHVGRAPSDEYTIERIDNDQGYEPGNVKWATYAEQNRNHRNNVVLTHNGKTMIMKDWADHLGFGSHVIEKRLAMGWSVEKTLTTPLSERHSHPKQE